MDEAFDSLYDILYQNVVGSEQDRAEAIQAAIVKFKEAFQAETSWWLTSTEHGRQSGVHSCRKLKLLYRGIL
jgi:hypothetical protein